jgi:hypothetical protein
MPGLSADAGDKMAEAVLTRQRLVLDERRPELAVVLAEGALHAQVGGAEVMRAQLDRLSQLTSSCPQLTLRVLPFTSGAPTAGSSGPFTILRFAGTPSLGLVHLAGLPGQGGICLDGLLDVGFYRQAFTHLKTSALGPPASARLLRSIAAGQRTLVTS